MKFERNLRYYLLKVEQDGELKKTPYPSLAEAERARKALEGLGIENVKIEDVFAPVLVTIPDNKTEVK